MEYGIGGLDWLVAPGIWGEDYGTMRATDATEDYPHWIFFPDALFPPHLLLALS